MKRTALSAALAAVALSVFAEPEEVAIVRFADAGALATASAKVGELTSFPMLGGILAAKTSELPLFRSFGDARPGACVGAVLFMDLEACTKSPGDMPDPDFAVLYPVEGREAFLARQSGHVQTNGLYFVKDADLGVKCDMYFDFTPDGKWVAACNKPGFVKKALAATPRCGKLTDGTVLQAAVRESGLRTLAAFLEAAIAEKKKLGADVAELDRLSGRDIARLKELGGLTFSLAVNDRGVSMRYSLRTKKGTGSEKLFATPLPAEALAFAGDDAYSASAAAANTDAGSLRPILDIVLKKIAESGVKLDFLNARLSADGFFSVIDVPALVAYFSGEGAEAVEKLDAEKLSESIAEACVAAKAEIDAAGPGPFRTSVAIKGAKPAVSVARRFSAVLPEAAGKPVATAGAGTLYGLALAVAGQLSTSLPKENADGLKALLPVFPKESTGGIASASWREGDTVRAVLRISADELGRFGTAVSVVMGMMAGQMFSPAVGGANED